MQNVLLKMLMCKDVASRREMGQKRCERQGSNNKDPLQPHELTQATPNTSRLGTPRPYQRTPPRRPIVLTSSRSRASAGSRMSGKK